MQRDVIIRLPTNTDADLIGDDEDVDKTKTVVTAEVSRGHEAIILNECVRAEAPSVEDIEVKSEIIDSMGIVSTAVSSDPAETTYTAGVEASKDIFEDTVMDMDTSDDSCDNVTDVISVVQLNEPCVQTSVTVNPSLSVPTPLDSSSSTNLVTVSVDTIVPTMTMPPLPPILESGPKFLNQNSQLCAPPLPPTSVMLKSMQPVSYTMSSGIQSFAMSTALCKTATNDVAAFYVPSTSTPSLHSMPLPNSSINTSPLLSYSYITTPPPPPPPTSDVVEPTSCLIGTISNPVLVSESGELNLPVSRIDPIVTHQLIMSEAAVSLPSASSQNVKNATLLSNAGDDLLQKSIVCDAPAGIAVASRDMNVVKYSLPISTAAISDPGVIYSAATSSPKTASICSSQLPSFASTPIPLVSTSMDVSVSTPQSPKENLTSTSIPSLVVCSQSQPAISSELDSSLGKELLHSINDKTAATTSVHTFTAKGIKTSGPVSLPSKIKTVPPVGIASVFRGNSDIELNKESPVSRPASVNDTPLSNIVGEKSEQPLSTGTLKPSPAPQLLSQIAATLTAINSLVANSSAATSSAAAIEAVANLQSKSDKYKPRPKSKQLDKYKKDADKEYTKEMKRSRKRKEHSRHKSSSGSSERRSKSSKHEPTTQHSHSSSHSTKCNKAANPLPTDKSSVSLDKRLIKLPSDPKLSPPAYDSKNIPHVPVYPRTVSTSLPDPPITLYPPVPPSDVNLLVSKTEPKVPLNVSLDTRTSNESSDKSDLPSAEVKILQPTVKTVDGANVDTTKDIEKLPVQDLQARLQYLNDLMKLKSQNAAASVSVDKEVAVPVPNTESAPVPNTGFAPGTNNESVPVTNTGSVPVTNTGSAPVTNTGSAPIPNTGPSVTQTVEAESDKNECSVSEVKPAVNPEELVGLPTSIINAVKGISPSILNTLRSAMALSTPSKPTEDLQESDNEEYGEWEKQSVVEPVIDPEQRRLEHEAASFFGKIASSDGCSTVAAGAESGLAEAIPGLTVVEDGKYIVINIQLFYFIVVDLFLHQLVCGCVLTCCVILCCFYICCWYFVPRASRAYRSRL